MILQKDGKRRTSTYGGGSSDAVVDKQDSRLMDTIPHNMQPAMLSKFQPITQENLQKLILSWNKKSCGLDPFPTKLLVSCLDCILPTLTKLVNLSLSTCVMPDKLKTAAVTPLLKKTGLDGDDMKNFRPVSNLPYISNAPNIYPTSSMSP